MTKLNLDAVCLFSSRRRKMNLHELLLLLVAVVRLFVCLLACLLAAGCGLLTLLADYLCMLTCLRA